MKGDKKVMYHLMFGILALMVDQIDAVFNLKVETEALQYQKCSN